MQFSNPSNNRWQPPKGHNRKLSVIRPSRLLVWVSLKLCCFLENLFWKSFREARHIILHIKRNLVFPSFRNSPIICFQRSNIGVRNYLLFIFEIHGNQLVFQTQTSSHVAALIDENSLVYPSCSSQIINWLYCQLYGSLNRIGCTELGPMA